MNIKSLFFFIDKTVTRYVFSSEDFTIIFILCSQIFISFMSNCFKRSNKTVRPFFWLINIGLAFFALFLL